MTKRAGVDIVVKVTDAEDHLRGRFLISANSLYYFRKNAKQPAKRYSWRQLIEMIETQMAAKPQRKTGQVKSAGSRNSSKKKA